MFKEPSINLPLNKRARLLGEVLGCNLETLYCLNPYSTADIFEWRGIQYEVRTWKEIIKSKTKASHYLPYVRFKIKFGIRELGRQSKRYVK
jgi:hypothetical protein